MDDSVREEGLDVLREAVHWWLPSDLWAAAERLLAGMGRAWTAGDAVAFRRAVHSLEAFGPRRVLPLEEAPSVPPPAPVRERLNELVHTLEGLPPVVPGQAEAE
jgi:hypothetical protein